MIALKLAGWVSILVLGSGGREHAIIEKIKSETDQPIYFAPGNAGVQEELALALDILDFDALLREIEYRKISLLIVGPEVPLAAGIVDYFNEKKPELVVFGPDKDSAQLEASKIFSYNFMKKYNIRTAESKVAETLEKAIEIIDSFDLPVVLKADGLAAGKGVAIFKEKAKAKVWASSVLTEKIFGEAGTRLQIQKFMSGSEASLFVILNGKEGIFLPTARDYKAAYDNNEGPNTGGMGSFSPGNIITEEQIAYVNETIVQSVIKEFSYRGILYIGLMIHSKEKDDLSVVEFNCRLGDPETQSVMPMIESTLLPYIHWSAGEDIMVPCVLHEGYKAMPQKSGVVLNVVLSAKGYPGKYDKELQLLLPEKMPAQISIIHAGTKKKNGVIVSNGGRICNIVGRGKNLAEARVLVYDFIDSLKSNNDFSLFHYRLDIGKDLKVAQ